MSGDIIPFKGAGPPVSVEPPPPDQEPLITAIRSMFAERGWSVVSDGRASVAMSGQGRRVECILQRSGAVAALSREGGQVLSEVATEPWCLVVVDSLRDRPFYVPLPERLVLAPGAHGEELAGHVGLALRR